MLRFTKVIATIMLSVTAVCFVSCGNNGSNSQYENEGNNPKEETKIPQNINGHEFVDLDLPSGTLWATCNVGTVSPEGYGEYFCWGETRPKSYYGLKEYKYFWEGNGDRVTKYCNNAGLGYNGCYDNLMTLEPGDDAAVVNWGGAWRMPTRAEWQELIGYTTHTMTTFKDVPGVLFSGSNGKTLFLPAAGYKNNSELYYAGYSGYYWSSSVGTYGPWGGSYFLFDVNGENFAIGNFDRSEGLMVRPVCSKNDF